MWRELRRSQLHFLLKKRMLNLVSPAKINLFFRVLRKRPDGYHDIESVYQAIDLFDRLFFSPSSQDKITCTDPSIPTDASNLVHKAIESFRSRFSLQPIHVHIEKKIPVQAGLGGGSSNAATTLWALNELSGRPAKLNELIEMGAGIGSDVAFFFSQGTALCKGRGEILEPYELKEGIEGWIMKPEYGLSTPLVYKHTKIEELPERSKEFHFFNDLEIPAFVLEPRLVTLRDCLQKSFRQVTMTGSGTAFFCQDGVPPSIEGVACYPFRSVYRKDYLEWFA
jgi:4-diphosphocytidyl-2-C-methyl-D-erythritol kinase